MVKWALGGGIAVASGPLIGGILSEVDWRLIFVLNLPAGVVALRVLSRVPPSPRRPRPIDPYGQVAAMLAMGGLVYAVIEGGHSGITPPVVVALALCFVGTLGVGLSTALLAHPLLPRQLFASRSFRIAQVTGFAFMVGHYGLLFVMSLDLQQNRDLSPGAAGLVFVPMLMIGVALTPLAASGVERYGARALTTCGLLVMAVGLLLLAGLPPNAPIWAISLSMMLVGLGGPIIVPPITMVVLDQVPDGLIGIAGGVFNTSRQLGGALSVGFFGAVLAGFDEDGRGVRFCLLTAAVVVLVASAASFRLPTAQSRSAIGS